MRERDQTRLAKAELINVVGAGRALTTAYEQLRNAAENSEEHLLLQNAIRRFYRHIFLMEESQRLDESGNELIVELTLAGYAVNNSISKQQAQDITKRAKTHYQTYMKLQERHGVKGSMALGWVIDVLAVDIASVLRPRYEDELFVEFVYEYFASIIPEKTAKQTDDFAAALFIAIHRALLKSNGAGMRANLLKRYSVQASHVEQFLEYNKRIDIVLEADATDKLYHTVDRQGAPLRVLWRMIGSREDMPQLLAKRTAFLGAFETQVATEYARISTRIDRAVGRSVAFLIITKVLIGLAIEVPYDIFVHGGIIWLPLVINLLFPPVYMILLRLTLTMPGQTNTTALVDRIDGLLYGGETQMLSKASIGYKRHSTLFSAAYGVMGVVVLGLVTWALLALQFAFVHILIFITFVSAASFLSFRLGHLVRELELVRAKSTGVTMLRDFIYLPFVVLGRWMSDKYSKLNIITIILDVAIEMPLKTVLRLLRQWNAFIDERKDDLV